MHLPPATVEPPTHAKGTDAARQCPWRPAHPGHRQTELPAAAGGTHVRRQCARARGWWPSGRCLHCLATTLLRHAPPLQSDARRCPAPKEVADHRARWQSARWSASHLTASDPVHSQPLVPPALGRPTHPAPPSARRTENASGPDVLPQGSGWSCLCQRRLPVSVACAAATVA